MTKRVPRKRIAARSGLIFTGRAATSAATTFCDVASRERRRVVEPAGIDRLRGGGHLERRVVVGAADEEGGRLVDRVPERDELGMRDERRARRGSRSGAAPCRGSRIVPGQAERQLAEHGHGDEVARERGGARVVAARREERVVDLHAEERRALRRRSCASISAFSFCASGAELDGLAELGGGDLEELLDARGGVRERRARELARSARARPRASPRRASRASAAARAARGRAASCRRAGATRGRRRRSSRTRASLRRRCPRRRTGRGGCRPGRRRTRSSRAPRRRRGSSGRFWTAGTIFTPVSECGVAGPAYAGALLPSKRHDRRRCRSAPPRSAARTPSASSATSSSSRIVLARAAAGRRHGERGHEREQSAETSRRLVIVSSFRARPGRACRRRSRTRRRRDREAPAA